MPTTRLIVLYRLLGRQTESLQARARVSGSPEWCKDDRRQNTTKVSHAGAKRGAAAAIFAIRAVPGAAAAGGGLAVDERVTHEAAEVVMVC